MMEDHGTGRCSFVQANALQTEYNLAFNHILTSDIQKIALLIKLSSYLLIRIIPGILSPRNVTNVSVTLFKESL